MTSANKGPIPPPILTTPRLILRPLIDADFDDLAAILQDPVAMTAYEGPFSDEEVGRWLDRQAERYAIDGFGLWAVVSRDTGQMIGDCGLTWQNMGDVRHLEVGYHLKRVVWHHGYATEAGAACRDWAFDRLNASEVFAHVRDINIASMNVAIRLGMEVRARFTTHYRGVDMPHYAFSVRRG